ncbi:unnamed protein product, partial [Didymodactylos carnosus]
EHFPQLNNCSTVTTEHYCYAGIYWYKSETSYLQIIAEFEESFDPDSGINTYIVDPPSNFGSVFNATHYLIHSCNTDNCNDPMNLRLLLKSLKISADLIKIKPLLSSNQPVNKSSCLIFSNDTDSFEGSCTIDDQCNYCDMTMITKSLKSYVCCGCSYTDPSQSDDYQFQVQMSCNMKEKKCQHQIHLNCNVPQCNFLENVKRIQQMYENEFNFDTFVQSTANAINSTETCLFLIKLSI